MRAGHSLPKAAVSSILTRWSCMIVRAHSASKARQIQRQKLEEPFAQFVGDTMVKWDQELYWSVDTLHKADAICAARRGLIAGLRAGALIGLVVGGFVGILIQIYPIQQRK